MKSPFIGDWKKLVSDHKPALIQPDKIAVKDRTDPLLYYLPIRPSCDVYDQVYHTTNSLYKAGGDLMCKLKIAIGKLGSSEVNRHIWTQLKDILIKRGLAPTLHELEFTEDVGPRKPLVCPFRDGFNSITDLESPLSVCYLINDSHYYLSDVRWNALPFGLSFISGGLFSPTPGKDIYLPFGCGSYSLYPDVPRTLITKKWVASKISMTTTSSGTYYNHPNVFINYVDFLIDYGWYKQFRTIVPTRSLIIRRQTFPTNLVVNGNPQRQFMEMVVEGKDLLRKSTAHRFLLAKPLKMKLTDTGLFSKSLVRLKGIPNSDRGELFKYLMSGPYPSGTDETWYQRFFPRCLFGDFKTDIPEFDSAGRFSYLTDVVRVGGEVTPTVKITDYYVDKMSQGNDPALIEDTIQASKDVRSILKQGITKTSMKSDFARTVDSESYYKQYPIDKLGPVNEEIIQEKYSTYFQEVTRELNTKLANGELINDVGRSILLTKTGYDVNQYEEQIYEFEWSHTSHQNAVAALYTRQLGSLLNPDPHVVEQFSSMCKRFWSWFGLKWSAEPIEIEKCFLDMLQDKTDFDLSKKMKYHDTIMGQKSGRIQKFVGSFTTMVKSGETQYTCNFTYNSRGELLNQDSRPRNISVPDPVT